MSRYTTIGTDHLTKGVMHASRSSHERTGRLIGMNTAIYSPSGASAGIGFAIPVDTLKHQVETIIKDGKKDSYARKDLRR